LEWVASFFSDRIPLGSWSEKKKAGFSRLFPLVIGNYLTMLKNFNKILWITFILSIPVFSFADEIPSIVKTADSAGNWSFSNSTSSFSYLGVQMSCVEHGITDSYYFTSSFSLPQAGNFFVDSLIGSDFSEKQDFCNSYSDYVNRVIIYIQGSSSYARSIIFLLNSSGEIYNIDGSDVDPINFNTRIVSFNPTFLEASGSHTVGFTHYVSDSDWDDTVCIESKLRSIGDGGYFSSSFYAWFRSLISDDCFEVAPSYGNYETEVDFEKVGLYRWDVEIKKDRVLKLIGSTSEPSIL